MATGPDPLLQIVTCPGCELPAEVLARSVLESTDGPVEHVRIRCVGLHVFNLPAAMLASSVRPCPIGPSPAGSSSAIRPTTPSPPGPGQDRQPAPRSDPRTTSDRS